MTVLPTYCDVDEALSRGVPPAGTTNGDDYYREEFAIFKSFIAECGIPPDGRLLETGCGNGDLTLRFHDLGFHAEGVDIAPMAISMARTRSRVMCPSPRFHLGNIVDLVTMTDAKYDVLIDRNCLHCIIGDDRARFLAATRRVVKPGGSMIFKTWCGDPDPAMVFDFEQKARTALCRGNIPSSRNTVYAGVPTRYFGTVASILDEVLAPGLIIDRSRTITDSGHEKLLIHARSQ